MSQNDKENKQHDEQPYSKITYQEKFDSKTDLNDPDLLVGPYKPIEGQPNTIKCPNCGEEMPSTIDTCVNCGHYLKREETRYKPMDESKARKIRWTIGIILLVGFAIYMILKSAL